MMMDYQSEPCICCGEQMVIYHQYIADSRCEACGEWQDEDDATTFEEEKEYA